MNLRLIVVLSTLLATVACSESAQWQGTIEESNGVVYTRNPAADPGPEGAEPPFALVLEQTFGAEEEPADSLLSFITGMAVDEAGNVYVVDRGDDRLVAFAPDGKLLWAGGRSGQGPGEFQGANWVAWDGDGRLYVDNHNGGQIDTWSTAGEYLDSQVLAEFDISQGYVVGLPDPKTIVLSSRSQTDGDGALVHVFDITNDWLRTGKFFARGGRLADSPERAFWATVRVRVSGDSIWAGNRLQYELCEYGLIARHWLVGFDGVEEFKRRWDQYLASGNREEDILSFDSALDLIDAEGRVLGSLPIGGAFWDSIGTLEAVGPDGRIYTRVFEPFPHVRRYRVEIDP